MKRFLTITVLVTTLTICLPACSKKKPVENHESTEHLALMHHEQVQHNETAQPVKHEIPSKEDYAL